uniref:Uncharacterized protein n=1 Tax=viral metagenome TaxID=1070528 RepID=A0A6H2A0Q7_9ZZZZ
MNRIVFSCPRCTWRRKTYIENENLYIKCRRCGHKFIVGNGSNIVYVEAHNTPPESARDYYIPCEDDGISEEEKRFKRIKNIIHVMILIAFHVWMYIYFFT